MFFRKRSEIREKVEIDSDTLQVLIGESYGNHVSWTGINAIRNSDIFTAIKTIASDVASSKIEVTIKDNGFEEVQKELNYLLNKRPNNILNPWNFKATIITNMLVNNCSFVQILKDKKGFPQELFMLRNSDVTIKEDKGAILYEVLSDARGKSCILDASDVLHFRMMTFDGFTAYGPLYALVKEIGIQEGSKDFLRNFFKQGAGVGGTLKFNGAKMSTEEKEEHSKVFSKMYAGAQNSSKVIVLDETMDFKQLEMPTESLKFINSYNFTSQQVAKAFGLPLSKMGIETVNTSMTQENTTYLQSTLNPIFQCMISEMEYKLIPHPLNYNTEITFNTEWLLEADPEMKLKIVTSLKNTGLLNTNEGRKKYNLSPVFEGDKLQASLNYTFLERLDDYQKSRLKNEGGDKVE